MSKTGCTGYKHSSTADDENSEYLTDYYIESCKCYETGFVFKSLMARGKKLLLSLSVFAIMLLKRLPDSSKMKRWLPG